MEKRRMEKMVQGSYGSSSSASGCVAAAAAAGDRSNRSL